MRLATASDTRLLNLSFGSYQEGTISACPLHNFGYLFQRRSSLITVHSSPKTSGNLLHARR